MGTQVLPAQNFLVHQNPPVFHGRLKPYCAYKPTDPRRQTNNNSHRKSNARRRLQKRTDFAINRSTSVPELTAKHQNRKRPPPARTVKRAESVGCIENVTKTNRVRNSDDWYAGSTFVQSPSPKCLPLPSLMISKKQVSVTFDYNNDETATKDLRRLLRLQ